MNRAGLQPLAKGFADIIVENWLKFDEFHKTIQHNHQAQLKVFVPQITSDIFEEQQNENHIYYEQLNMQLSVEDSEQKKSAQIDTFIRNEVLKAQTTKKNDKPASKSDESKQKTSFQTLKSLFKKLQNSN